MQERQLDFLTKSNKFTTFLKLLGLLGQLAAKVTLIIYTTTSVVAEDVGDGIELVPELLSGKLPAILNFFVIGDDSTAAHVCATQERQSITGG